MTPPKRRPRDAAFTLIELMLVVAIIGILASVAIPGFNAYVKRSRTVEAVGHIEKLWSASVAYYETDHTAADGTAVPKQFPGSNSVSNEPNCCFYSDQLCPASPDVYQYGDSTSSPWQALNFNIASKHRYWPIYFAFPTLQQVWLLVQGDQDCDSTLAQFELKADVVQGSPHRIGVYVTNELE